ncbi:MAG: hypothetical protein A2X09_16315 [Bacteroidetes bacterium GWF2_43_11]|nr:MAG: hypothetical protein A2X09_16315 [Bacteroidetes bacterium GWF2_43_11]
MFKSYLKTTWRNLTRNKFYAIINIAGLSIGILTAIFLLLFVQDELTYDKHNEKYKRIYRLESHFDIAGKQDLFAVVPIPMAPALKIEFPEIENIVRFAPEQDIRMRYGENEFAEEHICYTDSTVFDIFTHHFISGTPERALTEPFTCVITESFAKKSFGDENPMGKMLESSRGRSFKVTAVIKDLPENSHLKYDCLLSASSIVQIIGAERFNNLKPEAFWNIGLYAYVLMKPNTDAGVLHTKFQPFYDKYMAPVGEKINASYTLLTTRLDKIHHTSNLGADQPVGNMAYVYIFGAVGIFILILAGINYMNMATARGAERSREIGIRKVAGAHRQQLIGQFISESLLLSFISFLISIAFVILLLPFFNELAGKQMGYEKLLQPLIIFGGLAITLIIGVASGSYPAFYLSSFEPAMVLKGAVVKGKGTMRRILVVLQFLVSIIMIIATLTVGSQLSFLQKTDLGFEKDNVIVAPITDTAMRHKVDVLRNALLENSNIQQVATSSGTPGNQGSIVVMRVEKPDGTMTEQTLNFMMIDTSYLDLMKFRLIAGRNFSRTMSTDLKEGVIINETAANKLGWGENALGRKIDFGVDIDGSVQRNTKVIGVIKDFNYQSLHNPVEPIVLFLNERPSYYLSIRTNGGNKQEVIDFIRNTYQKTGAVVPLDYQYLDQTMDKMYTAEIKLGTIFTVASALSIFIALLGLLGLASFIIRRRTKEIGIRKVLGAPVTSLFFLLNKEFVILVAIAFVLAAPVAWYLTGIWLSNFAFHTTVGWLIYVEAALVSLAVALVTTSFHILKATNSNPVDAIKYE